MSTIDRRSLRRQLSIMTFEEITEALTCIADACAEHAREMRMTAPEFVKFMIESWANAHGLEVKECSVQPAAPTPGVTDVFDTKTVFVPKWKAS